LAEAPLRIGLVGAGAIMRLSHAPTIARSPDATLAAVFDVDPVRAETLARDFGAPRWTGDLAALVEGRDVDAVIVATPNLHHPEAVIAAAGAGTNQQGGGGQ
jgi:predicted dehydrogenase